MERFKGIANQHTSKARNKKRRIVLKKGTYVSKAVFQKLAEENKKMRADLRLIIMGTGKVDIRLSIIKKWKEIFEEEDKINKLIQDALKASEPFVLNIVGANADFSEFTVNNHFIPELNGTYKVVKKVDLSKDLPPVLDQGQLGSSAACAGASTLQYLVKRTKKSERHFKYYEEREL